MSSSGAPSGRGLTYLAAAALTAAGAVILAPMLTYPFGSDHGSFATAAEVMARGGKLYRDVWELKPPGIYYLFRLGFALFGRAMVSIRLLDLLWTLAAAGCLVLMARRWSSVWQGVAGGFFFLACYALGFDFWHTAQCDGLTSLPLALAALAMLSAERRRSPPMALVAGALVGLAALLKFTVVGFLALPLLAALTAREEAMRSRLLRAGCYTLGFLLPLVAATLWLWRLGTLRDMYEIVFVWNSKYGHIRPTAPQWHVIPMQVLRFLFGGQYVMLKLIGALGVWGTVELALRRRDVKLWWLAPAWAAVMLAGVAAQGKYFAYHWLPALPPLGLLAGHGLWGVVRRLSAIRPLVAGRAAAAAAVAAVAIVLLVGYWAHFRPAILYVTGRMPAQEYLAQFASPGGYFSYLADAAAAEEVRRVTPPGESVFVWGMEPLVYFLADRPPATRFIHAAPLLSPWSPPVWRKQAVEQLRKSNPRLILVVRNDAQPWATGWMGDSASALGSYPELWDFIRTGYRPAARIEDFDVLERRQE